MYLVMASVLPWIWVFRMLKDPNGEERGSSSSTSTSSPSAPCCAKFWKEFVGVVNPPVVGALLGLFVGSVSPLKHNLIVDPPVIVDCFRDVIQMMAVMFASCPCVCVFVEYLWQGAVPGVRVHECVFVSFQIHVHLCVCAYTHT